MKANKAEQTTLVSDFKAALSIKEVSEVTGVCRTRLYEEINAGRLVARKCGRRTLIFQEDLQAWLGDMPSYHNRGVSGRLA